METSPMSTPMSANTPTNTPMSTSPPMNTESSEKNEPQQPCRLSSSPSIRTCPKLYYLKHWVKDQDPPPSLLVDRAKCLREQFVKSRATKDDEISDETLLKQFFPKGIPRYAKSSVDPNVATDATTSHTTFQPTSAEAHTTTSFSSTKSESSAMSDSDIESKERVIDLPWKKEAECENVAKNVTNIQGNTGGAQEEEAEGAYSEVAAAEEAVDTAVQKEEVVGRKLGEEVEDATTVREFLLIHLYIFVEIEIAKKRHGQLNTIVMNVVMHACVHCTDIESALRVFDEMSGPEGCGVDNITYATLLKGLGDARGIDQAFQLLEAVEQGTAVGSPKLSPPFVSGLLNSLIEAGDLRRANGLLARYGFVLHEGGSVLVYNLLMKGYISTGCPEAALSLHDEILRHGLKLDKFTYNTLILACLETGKLDVAMQFFEGMKNSAQTVDDDDFLPDVVTYTTLLKGFGHAQDLSVQKIVTEMKSSNNLHIDRVAYTAIIDAFLNCGTIKGALTVYGELVKRAGQDSSLRPKPHLFLALMRTFAVRGEHEMVKKLYGRMWPDSCSYTPGQAHLVAKGLLDPGSPSDGPVLSQLDLALQYMKGNIEKWKQILWASRGGMVALRIEALLGSSVSIISPCILPQVSVRDTIEHIMVPFSEARPLQATLKLKQVIMRFFKDSTVPVIDDWGSCVGILHCEDCNELDAPLSAMMRSPPPSVTTSTSIGRVIDLMLEKRYKMVIVAKYENIQPVHAISLLYLSSFFSCTIFY
ncbi:hypothetical protein RND71_042545 [Anisodus tanguticus]|uniref:CBS domain-containing protein n=1 Tax=Anisodus tanguticus TaxID=243964 RepID=A0AAE1QSM1_9SOLA|nr:hypothetical protein RND71_042545 [Anisodus tanguticus]